MNVKLGLSNLSNPKTELSDWNVGIAPSFDWFVTDRLSIGIGFGFNYSSTEYLDSIPWYSGSGLYPDYFKVTSVSKKFSLTPRVSYHIPISDKLTFSFTGTLGFSWYGLGNKITMPERDSSNGLKLKADEPQTVEPETEWNPGFFVGVVPAINYFINDRLFLSLSVGSIEYVRRKERVFIYHSPDNYYNEERWASDFDAGFGSIGITLGVRF